MVSPAWMSNSNSWRRLCLSINKVTWIQRNNPKIRILAAGRFPEQEEWINSHKFIGSGHGQGMWWCSRQRTVFQVRILVVGDFDYLRSDKLPSHPNQCKTLVEEPKTLMSKPL